MLSRKILYYLRLFLILVFGSGFGLVVGGIYYLNQSGANKQWRAQIANELENFGIVSDFDRLTISLTKGLLASGVQIYANSDREEVIATLEHLVINVDKTKLMRGIVRVNQVELKDAMASIPIDPEEPSGPRIVIKKLSGNMHFPDKRTVEARNISGFIAGIEMEIDARIWSSNLGSTKPNDNTKDMRLARINLIARIVQEIKKWSWPEKKPPLLKLYIEGDIDKPDSIRLDFVFQAKELESRGITLRNIKFKGDYNHRLITLDKFELEDESGKITARADYHTSLSSGRFEANSSLHLQRLARNMFGYDILQQLTFSTSPRIDCTGTISFDKNFTPDLYISGTAKVDDFSCLGSRFKSLATDFSTRDDNIFLTGLRAAHPRGELSGRILVKNDDIRYEVDSDLPIDAYIPFVRDSPIENALKQVKFGESSNVQIHAAGTIDKNNLTDWSSTGKLKLSNIIYRGVPLHELAGDFEMNATRSTYRNIIADFDYRDYMLRKKHGGPTSAHVSIKSISVDRNEDIVSINDIRGTAWPAPIVRLFVPNVANHVENYKFHRPPSLRATGQFDIGKNGKRTDFNISVNNEGSMNYKFLEASLTLRRLKANVKISNGRVNIDKLSFLSFNGSCSGQLEVLTSDPLHTRYSGGIQWQRLHLKDIGKLYNFGNAERGLLTGRIDFEGQDNNMRSFNGKGSLSLEKGNLFSVPMLGPMSKLVGSVLGKRNPTEETAKDASSTFNIRSGVLYSNDFLANTRSLKFTGEGSIDLEKKVIDITMRMNARGLLGLFAIPLRPLMGLFQFQGKGSLTSPEWQTTVFTKTSRGKNDPIYRKPPRAEEVKE
jgi:hypothetical protein